MTSRWAVAIIFAMVVPGLTLPAGARAESVNLRVGVLIPRQQSDIWEQNRFETDLTKSQMIDFTVGAGLDLFLTDILSATVAISYYEKDRVVEDQDFVWPDGLPIQRNIHLTLVPLEFALKLLPMGRNQRVIPYLAGGVGIYFWQYVEEGDFVVDRFFDPFIAAGRFQADGQDLGWHAEIGFQIPWGRRTSFDWEAKYYSVNGDLGEDFDPAFAPIDLSGWSITVGISFWW